MFRPAYFLTQSSLQTSFCALGIGANNKVPSVILPRLGNGKGQVPCVILPRLGNGKGHLPQVYIKKYSTNCNHNPFRMVMCLIVCERMCPARCGPSYGSPYSASVFSFLLEVRFLPPQLVGKSTCRNPCAGLCFNINAKSIFQHLAQAVGTSWASLLTG